MTPAILPPAFDSLVLAAVAAEVADLAGGRVTGVGQPDDYTIALSIRSGRRPRTLVCSIHPRWARCLLAPAPAGPVRSTFAQQVKARLSGARLRSAAVPPFDRVLALTFETLEGVLTVVVEVMGRHSNLLLVEAGAGQAPGESVEAGAGSITGGRVAGLFKPVTSAMSRARPLLPGSSYIPPPRGRPTPPEVAAAELEGWLAEERPIAELLTSHLLGVSPPVATHLALRAGLDPRTPAPGRGSVVALQTALAELVEVVTTRSFSPVRYDAPDGTPVAYAAIPLLTYRTLAAHRVSSMSEAAAPVIKVQSRQAAIDERRQAVLARVREAQRRLARADAELQRRLEEAAHADRWRRWGELLLAYAPQVPAGAAEVTVPDFDGTPLAIPLDAARSPVENAQAFFRKYRKAAAGREVLARRTQVLAGERAYLRETQVLAEQATALEDLNGLARELAEEGIGAPPRGTRRAPEAPARPRAFTVADGFRVLVGRSSRENDHLTFHLADPEDLWLHARGMGGAHVILKTDGRTPTPGAVEAAAAIAAYFSEGRGSATVSVDVTARRHVRKPRGARPGAVSYREERTLFVEPRLPGDS